MFRVQQGILVLAGYGDRSMIVAVIAMRMVQVSVYQIINMVTMWNGLMSTAWTVDVACLVATTLMVWCTVVRICGCYFENMLIDMV